MLLTFLADIVAPVFYKLLYMSLTALVVGMIIMLIRRFADKRFSPFWKYTMWVLVLAALLLPWRPQSNLAVMNTTEKIQEVSFQEEYNYAQAEYHAALREEPVQGNLFHEPSEQLIKAKAKADSLHIKTLIFDSLLPALWLIGAAIIGLFMVFSGLRLGKKIKSLEIPFETERHENILQNCRQKLGVKRRVRMILQSYVKTPALFGLFCPKIILPGYTENLSDEHLKYVVLHELSHLKRGDTVVNTLLLILQAVYWFNPLTWFLFKFIREDMELANDAAVLKGMDKEEQKEYSISLVAVLAGYSRPSLVPRLLCMADSEKNMERRINMIKLGEFFKKRRLIIAIAGLLVIAITATLFLTAGVAKPDLMNDQNALMSSLGYTHVTLETIQKNKTPYVGNNSKAGAIVNQLPVTWKGLSYDSFSLQTNQEPYGLTIHYKETAENSLADWLDNPFSSAMEENNAMLLFASIDNLEEVRFVRPLDMQSKTFTRDTINTIFSGVPSIDDLTGIYNKLSKNLKMDEFYFAHAGRLYLLSSKPEDVIYRYGSEPDKTFINKSGLTVLKYDSEIYDSPPYFYFNKSGLLYAIRAVYNTEESYVDIIAKFGPPASEKTIGNQQYISYLLRRAASDEPEKYAYFVFEDNKVVESGLMVGNDHSLLNIEETNSEPNMNTGDSKMFYNAAHIQSD